MPSNFVTSEGETQRRTNDNYHPYLETASQDTDKVK